MRLLVAISMLSLILCGCAGNHKRSLTKDSSPVGAGSTNGTSYKSVLIEGCKTRLVMEQTRIAIADFDCLIEYKVSDRSGSGVLAATDSGKNALRVIAERTLSRFTAEALGTDAGKEQFGSELKSYLNAIPLRFEVTRCGVQGDFRFIPNALERNTMRAKEYNDYREAIDEEPSVVLSDAKFLELDGMSCGVKGIGNDKATVRFSILIEFEGGSATADKAIQWYREANRDAWLKVRAQDRMQLYQISTIEDLGFNARYQQDLKDELNAIPLKYPVANIYVAEKNVQRR